MASQDIIRKLDNVEFHDLIVESLEFINDGELRLVVTTSLYNDEEEEYQTLKLIFSQVIELTTDRIIMDMKSDLELNSFDYQFSEYFNCKMVFLTGPSKPSLTVELKCTEIDLVN